MLLFGVQFDTTTFDHFLYLLFPPLNYNICQFNNWIHNKLYKSTLKHFAISAFVIFNPFLTFGIKKVVSPEFTSHLFLINIEFLWVHLCKMVKCETPLILSRPKSNITPIRFTYELTHIWMLILIDDYIYFVNYFDKVLVAEFSIIF